RLRDVPSPKSRVVHEILSQSHAPGSKVPELRLPVCGFAELRFPESALVGSHAKILAGLVTETVRTALFVADDYQLLCRHSGKEDAGYAVRNSANRATPF